MNSFSVNVFVIECTDLCGPHLSIVWSLGHNTIDYCPYCVYLVGTTHGFVISGTMLHVLFKSNA